jgi:hypothetical protein
VVLIHFTCENPYTFALMKWLKIIFPFYLLVLFCLPCADFSAAAAHQTIDMGMKQDHEHDHQSEEKCSPFCTCACCSIQIQTQPHPTFSLVKIGLFNEKPNAKYHFYCQQVLYAIWQPPQLS